MGAFIPRIMDSPLAPAFRRAMRAIASPVYIVGARDRAGEFHGMAATAVSSLSMEPPSVMVAVNRQASVYGIIADTGLFSLNSLCVEQRDVIPAFSTSATRHSRFDPDRWVRGRDGLPQLKHAGFTLFCSVEASHDYGTHTVFIGLLCDAVVSDDPEQNPLVWLNGSSTGVYAA